MPKLRPIVPAVGRAMVRNILRNISGLGKEEVGAGRPELKCKTSNFQNLKLWTHFLPYMGSAIGQNPSKHRFLAIFFAGF